MKEKLLNLINQGERREVELKLAQDELPKNIFETVCAFLNRFGGHIILGVNDNKEIIGINPEKIKKIKSDFVTTCNNPEKLYPTVYLEIKEEEIDGKLLLYIFIPESSQVHRVKNKIFDRNEDGDFDITNNVNEVSNMYIRKRNTYVENTIYPYVTMKDLRKDLIKEARIRALNKTDNHPWETMTDFELLKSASLYDVDYQTGKKGFTLAAILLFGKDQTIASVLPFYRNDALLRIEDVDRYDDRDDIRTNLIDSYKRLTSFISKHLNDNFYLEKDTRKSARDIIARELVANMLIHRDYSNPAVSRLIIYKDHIHTENANKAKTMNYIKLDEYIPYPKNPVIARVFKEIGFADELGRVLKKFLNTLKFIQTKFQY